MIEQPRTTSPVAGLLPSQIGVTMTEETTPEPPVFCLARSPHGDGCTLAGGHPGMHERHFAGERMASWADPATCPANLPGDGHRGALRCARPAGHSGIHQDPDGTRWRAGYTVNDERRALGCPPMPAELAEWKREMEAGLHMIPAPAAPPVRMRLVQLPGLGQYALVVDRFRDTAHCDAERSTWEVLGERLGAVTTLVYPDELDVCADTAG